MPQQNPFAIIILLFLAVFLSSSRAEDQESPSAPPRVQELSSSTIENFFRLSDKVYSGGAPQGTNGFAELQKLGVRLIISVDGAWPQAELANQYGLKYVHLPLGYNGISRPVALKLVKAASQVDGPVFVHCHHGKHRGPAAAGFLCQTFAGWTSQNAVDWLERAGTSPEYPGLFKAVMEFKSPDAEELRAIPGEFPSRANVGKLSEVMVQIDRCWDYLEASEAKKRSDPDLDPIHASTLLQESFRELARTEEAKMKGKTFLDFLQASENASSNLKTFLTTLPHAERPEPEKISLYLKKLGQVCADCHKAFRN